MFAMKAATPSLRLTVTEMWDMLARAFGDTYHPERYYMRGPGPKWHEKHAADAQVDEGPVVSVTTLTAA